MVAKQRRRRTRVACSVKHSLDEGRQPIDLDRLVELGEMVWPGGGGQEILQLVDKAKAGVPIELGSLG
jgi:hypothetical protein